MLRALSVGSTKVLLWAAGPGISSVTVTPSQKIWPTRKYWAQSAKRDACVRMSDRGEAPAKLTQQLFFYGIVIHTPCVIWLSALLPLGFIRSAVQKPEPKVYGEVRAWKPGPSKLYEAAGISFLSNFCLQPPTRLASEDLAAYRFFQECDECPHVLFFWTLLTS